MRDHPVAVGPIRSPSLQESYADECAGKGRLRWRAHANSDERRVGSTRDRAAGSASLTQELRLIARGPAIGGKQDFIVLALHRAARNAIRSDDTDAWARRTRPAFLTGPGGPAGPGGPTGPGRLLGPQDQPGPVRPADPCCSRRRWRTKPAPSPNAAHALS